MSTRLEVQKSIWAPLLDKDDKNTREKNHDITTGSHSMVTPIFAQSLINVSGADAETFLDSQLSGDIKNINNNSLLPAGYCTPKGRLIATPYVIRDQSSFNLLLPHDLVDEFISRISRFILRAKVTISENQAIAMIGVIGETVTEIDKTQFDGLNCQKLKINQTQGIILCPNESLMSFWLKAKTIYSSSDFECWELENIRNGIVNIQDATKEQFLPQMINLEKREGVSFSKGCYPGQEIVARTKYLGSVKRKLCSFKSSALISPGATIVNSNGAVCGMVCHTARNIPTNNSQAGLAVIHIDNIDDVKLTTSDSIQIDAVTVI
ncbi:hypothetical protein N8Z26_01985 [Burkholderiales bacterium]|nr:hypothetical protein [Burkholderiales bacterium]